MRTKIAQIRQKVTQFAKSHKVISGIVVVLLLIGGYTLATGGGSVPDTDSADDTQATVVSVLSADEIQGSQVVATASGEIESLSEVTLSSEMFGTVTGVYVKIGDRVRAGQQLVQFRAADKAAQRTQAQADYEGAIAAKNSLLAQIDGAYANHEKLKLTVSSNITSAEAALRTAENNLQQVEQTGSNQQVDNAYANLFLTLQGIENATVSLLVTADSILGIDNQFVNDDFEEVLGVLDMSTLNISRDHYQEATRVLQAYSEQLSVVSASSAQQTISTAADTAVETLEVYQRLFTGLSALLASTPPIGGLSQTTLDSLIASVNSARSQVTSQQTALTNSRQAITTAKQSFSGAEIAYDKAVQDLADTKARSQADIAASEADLKRLESTIASQDASIKRARGSIAAVNAELAKASVRTPISGVVASVSVKQGAVVSNGAEVVKIVNTNGLQITTYVPASALASLQVGSTVLVEGEPIGRILRIAPSIDITTKKVEVVVGIEETDAGFVVGQFVELELLADQELQAAGVVLLPLEAVYVTAEEHSIFVIEDERVVAVPVETGMLVGNKIEIFSDISAYEQIIASVRGVQAGDRVTVSQ